MKTVLIHGYCTLYEKNEVCTFIDTLPDVFTIPNNGSYEEVLVVRKESYKPDITYGLIDKTYDLIIKIQDINYEFNNINPHPVELSSFMSIKFLSISRKSKTIYNHMLNNLGRQHSEYYRINCWSKPKSFIPEKDKEYLIRPLGGARGQYFIKPNFNLINIEKIMNNLSHHNLMEYLEKDYITMSTHKLKANDSFSDFFGTGADIVEVVPDVVREIRIISDCNSLPSICCDRMLEESGLHGIKQAIGSNNYPSDCYDFSSGELDLPSDVRQQIETIIANSGLPLHSFDLFITKEGKFGFFECCSQFGYEGLPTGIVPQMSQDYITKLLISPKC